MKYLLKKKNNFLLCVLLEKVVSGAFLPTRQFIPYLPFLLLLVTWLFIPIRTAPTRTTSNIQRRGVVEPNIRNLSLTERK